MPVEVLGLNGAPLAGDDFAVVENESRAREITEFRQRRRRDASAGARRRAARSSRCSRSIAAGDAKELPVVVKSDVQGSLEAIAGSLGQARRPTRSRSACCTAAVGGINESDVILAKASDAVDHRLQRPRQPAGARAWPGATASRSATTRSSTM